MMRHLAIYISFISSCLFGITSNMIAAPLNISDSPLFLTQAVPPLTMIIMERDHRLFYEAYNDTIDLNGDGAIDARYNPNIDYYGYFDSYKCYTYNSGSGEFDPASVTSTKKCSGQWSGDFLNYVTTSRMDALRKVLYGGNRSTDTSGTTVLQRAFIPQDAHTWGKEYTSVAVDGYNIADYTPLSVPATSGNHHLFANVTLLNATNPLLRVLTNQPYRIWEWVSIERPVAGSRVQNGGTGPTVTPTDYIVRVKVCDNTIGLEDNCRAYPNGNFKPIGLLQEFGENNQIKFGLLTGSYLKNLSGGVLRKNIGTFTDEVDLNTGIFTSLVGIVKTIDRINITNFGTNYVYNTSCGFIWTQPLTEGQCNSWGNPLAEMMYEGLRYFAGKTTPTTAYDYGSGTGDDTTLGLPKPAWQNPYNSANNKYCAKPNFLIVSDANPSYDSDQIPGSAFASFSGDLSPALDVSSLAQTIWTNELGGSSSHFIGQVATLYDGAPTAKTVGSFGNIRGLSPEAPTKQGSYYSASAAYYGWLNDINSVQDTQQVKSFVMSLASNIPPINIVVDGHTITLVPFGKSVGGCGGINATQGQFQPTNSVLDFYIESLTPTSGTFRANFDDSEVGGDQDMDAIEQYSYVVNANNTVTITVTDLYAGGCVIQHLGYVISGTTQDGPYLEVKDMDTASGGDVDYFLDTPPGVLPGGAWNDSIDLPTTATRTFTPSTTTAATILNSPLWYVAKWGGFTDRNNNNIPDLAIEWDTDNNGTPDNYFLITNALQLEAQFRAALNNILARTAGSASSVTNSGSLNTNSRLYIAIFNSGDWSGQFLSFPIDPSTGQLVTTGSATNGADWDSGSIITAQNYNTGRAIITYKPSSARGIPFRWPSDPSNPGTTELDTSQTTVLNTNPTTLVVDGLGSNRVNYIRGSSQDEITNGGTFRNRSSALGDIVDSNPAFIGPPNFAYRDDWGSGASENSAPYSAFRAGSAASRTGIVYVGANDGMLHAINATTGSELLAYVPSKIYTTINQLTASNYTHRYFVDGSPTVADVFYDGGWHTILVGGLNKGGQGIYALDVTDPSSFSESNANNLVLWEFTDANDADLGYTYSQPNIARMANGEWVAIFGNGLNNTDSDGASTSSTTGNAVVYIVDIKTGTLVKKIDTGVGSTQDPLSLGQPNGITSTVAVDINNDNIADYIYAADLFGHLWKIDVTSSSTTNWGLAFSGSPLFTAVNSSGERQNITGQIVAGPLLTISGVTQIYFGTGKYLESTDKTSTQIQSFYAITDDGSGPIASRSSLLEQTVLSEQSVTKGTTTSTIRLTSDNTRSGSDRGWFIDLSLSGATTGERSVTRSILRGTRVIFTTLIPSVDPCQFGGTSWLMELAAYDGRHLSDSPFDLNQDNVFNVDDKITYGNNGDVIAASGLQSLSGIFATPAILSAGGTEYKYMTSTAGSVQSVTENPSIKEGQQSWRQIK